MTRLPAQSVTAPAAVECVGALAFSPGLRLPTEPRPFAWDFVATCAFASADGVETFVVSFSGTGHGGCGLATASGGTGTVTSASGTTTLSNFGWILVGNVLVMTGNHDTPGSLGEFVAAGPVSSLYVECLRDEGATSFGVALVGELS